MPNKVGVDAILRRYHNHKKCISDSVGNMHNMLDWMCALRARQVLGVRRGELWDGGRPRAGEGRHVGGAGLAVHPGRQEQGHAGWRAAGERRGHRHGALGQVRPQLLQARSPRSPADCVGLRAACLAGALA